MSRQFVNWLPSVFPLRPLVDDASPKSTTQLCAGDIVITAFSQGVSGSGDTAMYIVPTVNVSTGSRFNVTRYSRTASPTAGAASGMILNLTTTAPLRRGRVYGVVGTASTMELQDTGGGVFGEALPGQAWPASTSSDDTIMLYTQAGAFCPLHAVGFRGTDGSLPVYGGLAPEATVTLPTPITPGLPLVYSAQYINTSPTFLPPPPTDVHAVIPAAGMQSLARTMYMNGGADFVDIGPASTVSLPDFTTHITPDVGTMVFTQYFLGSSSNGFTRWEVATLEPMAAGTKVSFGKSAIVNYANNERFNQQGFTVTVPVDVAAGSSFRVSTGVQGGAVVVQLTYRPISGPTQDWTSAITTNTMSPASSPAEAWRSVYAQALNPLSDEVMYVLGALHTTALTVQDDVPLTSVAEFERLPASARCLWPERGALLPNQQLRMTDVGRELLKSAKPEPGSTGVLIL